MTQFAYLGKLKCKFLWPDYIHHNHQGLRPFRRSTGGSVDGRTTRFPAGKFMVAYIQSQLRRQRCVTTSRNGELLYQSCVILPAERACRKSNEPVKAWQDDSNNKHDANLTSVVYFLILYSNLF